jgi:hypothetical protein
VIAMELCSGSYGIGKPTRNNSFFEIAHSQVFSRTPGYFSLWLSADQFAEIVVESPATGKLALKAEAAF